MRALSNEERELINGGCFWPNIDQIRKILDVIDDIINESDDGQVH